MEPSKATESHFVPTPESVKKPDSFRTRRVWDSKIFKFGLAGALIGSTVMALTAYFMIRAAVEIPGLQDFTSAGGFFVIVLASAGFILFAIIGSLVALYRRG